MDAEIIKTIDDELHQIFDSCKGVDEEMLMKNAMALVKPPHTTTIRINSLQISSESAIEQIRLGIQTREQIDFNVRAHHQFPDLILVSSTNANKAKNAVPFNRRAIVSVECGQSVLRGASVYAPGVIAIEMMIGGAEEDPDNISVWVDLEGKCTRGLTKRYTGQVLFVGNGRILMKRDELFRQSSTPVCGVAIEMHQSMPSFEKLDYSLFYPQNLPSYLTVKELDVRPGLRVLDMCASPGGKTTHIATEMKNSGLLVCLDKSAKKITTLRTTLDTWGVTCAHVLVADATRFKLDNLPAAQSNQTILFDRILLDPPCSGFGQRPMLQVKSASNSRGVDYSTYQKRLAENAARLLAPGGILVYSTCSMALKENESVVQHLLQTTNLRLLPPLYPAYGSDGISPVGSMVRRFWPSGPEDTIGFFYARFTKPLDNQKEFSS